MKTRLEWKHLFYVLAAVAAVILLAGGAGTGGEPNASKDEKRIAQVLQAMEGAGKVEVALFYREEEAAFAGAKAEPGRPTGAVVVAQGADQIKVKLALIRAVRTLLGLPENAVDVFEMEDDH